MDGHRLFLDVVLGEQSGLAGHHLLNGSRNHQVVDVIVRPSRFPVFRWNNLQEKNRTETFLLERLRAGEHDSDSR